MEDDETQPSTARQAILYRTSQACQKCRSLKTRCLPSSQTGTCQRCLSAGRECIWAEAPRRSRKLRAPSRISQVEQKIDGLVAKLVNPVVAAETTAVAVSTANGSGCAPVVNGRSADGSRELVPGTWLPFPSSFETRPEGDSLGQRPLPSPFEQRSEPSAIGQRIQPSPFEQRPQQSPFEQLSEPSETPVQQLDEGHDAADQQYIEQIRSIHRFGDPADHAQYPESLFRPSKQREDPIKDDLVDRLLASGEADALLTEYKKMSASFPFVPFEADMTAQQLYGDSPMLFLAIMTAASWREHQRQMALDTIFRQELANRTIIRPRRNLGLVQSVLVYLAWYHFVFSHKTQQIFFLHHLVIGLAIDIGLHRDFQPLFFPHTKKTTDVDPKEKHARKRTFLGCYYLASMVSAAMQKPNLLKHSPDMTEWAQELKEHGEFATDEVLGHLISLRQLDDEVQDTLFHGAGAEARLTDPRVVMHVRFLETRLEAWKRESEGVACKRMLLLSHAYTDMILHTIALRAPPSSQPPLNDSSLIKPLLATLEAAKRFFDAFLSFPASDYHLISFPEWMRLPSVMMTVAKLCIPSAAHAAVGWDTKAAQDLVRLDICLEALCYRFQNQTTYDKVTQTHPDFWYAMRFVTDLTRTWYVRKISGEEGSERRSAASQGSVRNLRGVQATGTLPTPPDGPAQGPFTDFGSVDFSSMDMSAGIGGEGENDPFAFMKSADFDMEQFFDIGIWGDEAYQGMGFGGGGLPF